MNNSNGFVMSSESSERVTHTVTSWNSWNTTGNGWTKDVCITTQEISLTINLVAMCVGLFIIFGNVLVLFVLYKYPSKRFTPFNWLLCHLAVADLAVGVTVFWWYGLAEILGIFITLYQKVIFYSISIIAVLASFEGLMMIAIDRYFLILHQTKYRSFISKKRLAVTIAIMWLLPSLIELLGPAIGWSCVDKCDCRIHNRAPDDVYCFGEECSHMLPPLTKHQLVFGSCSSLVMFLITLVVYIRIFNRVQKQSRKLENCMSSRRHTSVVNSIASAPKHSPNIHSNEGRYPPSSPTPDANMRKRNRAGWRHNLVPLNEKKSMEMRSSIRLNSFIETFEISQNESEIETDEGKTKTFNVMNGGDSATTASTEKTLRGSKLMSASDDPYQWIIRQESRDSVFTTTTEFSPTLVEQSACDDSSATNAFVKCNRDSINVDANSQRSNENTDYPTSLVVPVQLQPVKIPKKESRPNDNFRKSITENVVKTFNRLTRKKGGRQRVSTSRKRDLRIMRSMFVILSVFVITTAPLLIFIFYTFFNNDRRLKEIFNILLQITTLNSFLNPILYFWRLPQMRKRILKLMKARYWRKKWNAMTSWCRKEPPTTPTNNNLGTSEPSSESDPSEA